MKAIGPMSYVPQSQNHNLLSPTSPPQTPFGDSDSEPPPLPDRKRATFKFPTVHRRSPFSSPRGSPRTSPAPSPRHSPFNSPRTSPVGSPMGLPRKLPPPLPPSDYPSDSDQPPIIPPKPQLSDSIRRTYQFRRVNSNPHWIKDNAGEESNNSLTKQLSKSYDQLHFSGTEGIDEQIQPHPNENENEIRNSDGTRITESANDLEGHCFVSEGSNILSDCIDTSTGSSEERKTDRDEKRQSAPQEIFSSCSYPPPVPMHRRVEGREVPFLPQRIPPSAPFSEGGDGYDEFPDEPNVDIEQHLRDNNRIKISLQASGFTPLHGEVRTRPGAENDFATELRSVKNCEILGAKKRTNMNENEIINGNERQNVFPNTIYETVYPEEEANDDIETIGVVSHEVKVRPEHRMEDRRKSCPMLSSSSDADESVSDRRSSTLDRFTSRPLGDGGERNLGFSAPQRPVPLPPGTSRKDFELNYSVERKDDCLMRDRMDASNEEREMDDFESGTKAKMSMEPPPSSRRTEVPDANGKEAFGSDDQPAPVLPLKKKQSIKYQRGGHTQQSSNTDNSQARPVEPRNDNAKKGVYYPLPTTVPTVQESESEDGFFVENENVSEFSLYECPTKIISETHKDDDNTDGGLGFEDDFSSMFPTVNQNPMDPFYDDDFFKISRPKLPAESREIEEPNQSSRKPRSTKQVVNGEPVSIGRDEELDSLVDEKTGRTMVAGPGRFFRSGQAVGPQRPIEFYRDDYNILMSQGYSRAQITRALVVADNNFAIARKILTEFASPGK